MFEFFVESYRAFKAAHVVYAVLYVLFQCLSALGGEPRSWFDGDEAPPAVTPVKAEIQEPVERPFAITKDDCFRPTDAAEPPMPTPDDLPAIPPLKLPQPKQLQAQPQRPQPKRVIVQPADDYEYRPHSSDPPTMFAALRQSVHIDYDAIETYQAACDGQKKHKLVGLAPVWCVACWKHPPGYPDKDSPGVPRKTSPVSYLSHPLIEIEWRAEEYENCDIYPAVYDPATKRYYHEASLESGEELVKRMNFYREDLGVAMLAEPKENHSFGTIDRHYVKSLFAGLKPTGQGGIDNTRQTLPIDSMLSVKLPESMHFRWKTDEKSIKVLFTKKPSVLAWEVSGATITSNGLTLNIDYFPDITLEFR